MILILCVFVIENKTLRNKEKDVRKYWKEKEKKVADNDTEDINFLLDLDGDEIAVSLMGKMIPKCDFLYFAVISTTKQRQTIAKQTRNSSIFISSPESH